MRNYKEDPIYLVMDLETKLVYVRAPSAACATSLSLGLLNSSAFSLPSQLAHRRDEWDDCNFNRNLFRMTSSGFQFEPVLAESLPEQQLRNRELALIRSAFLYSLEIYCAGELTRIASYMPQDLVPFLYEELNGSDPDRDAYAQGIEEYAAIHQISCAAAYMELKMKLHASGIVKLRNHAIYEKFALEMTRSQSKAELEAVHNQAFNILFNNSKI